MKKIMIALCGLMLMGTTLSFGQAKKPTIMVLPSDLWCNTNGFMMEFRQPRNQSKNSKL